MHVAIAAAADAHRAVEAVWRIESARVVGALARTTGDLGRAEDLAQEALLVALERWPRDGVPDRPGAWLTTTAKHRLVDEQRRRARLDERHERLAAELERETPAPDPAQAAADPVGDDRLTLILVCCHPLLPLPARVALTLRLVAGLTSDEVARAFLTPVATVQQRVVRAKRTLAEANVPFATPAGGELAERLPAVLGVLYLIFNEGHTATRGDDVMRPDLVHEALRLARLLAALAPDVAEVHGLLALLELQASRVGARIDRDGAPVLLLDQDRRRWDLLLIGRGLRALDRARALGGERGPYALQARIAACHARARRAEDTDWPRIAALYDVLSVVARSPVVDLNRAVALGMAEGPQAGLDLVEQIVETGALADYHLLPSVRGDLLERVGRTDEARAELERAARMTGNAGERLILRRRVAALGG